MYAVVLLVCLSWVALLCFSVKAYGKVYIYYTLNLVQYCWCVKNGRACHIRRSTIDIPRCKEIVLEYLCKYGTIKNSRREMTLNSRFSKLHTNEDDASKNNRRRVTLCPVNINWNALLIFIYAFIFILCKLNLLKKNHMC